MQSSLCQSLHEIQLHPPNGSCFLHIQDTFRVPPYGFKTTNEIISYCTEDQEANIYIRSLVSLSLLLSRFCHTRSWCEAACLLQGCSPEEASVSSQFCSESHSSGGAWRTPALSPRNSRETLLRCSVPPLVLELISYLFSGEGPQLSS